MRAMPRACPQHKASRGYCYRRRKQGLAAVNMRVRHSGISFSEVTRAMVIGNCWSLPAGRMCADTAPVIASGLARR